MGNKGKTFIKADDLYQFQMITSFDVSPDGTHVVYSVQRVDKKTQKIFSNLWLTSTGKNRSWQFTFGDHVDTKPTWSPDGKEIAFLSNRKDEKQSQVYIIRFNGGEARQLSNMKGQFALFDWSPDGKKLLCLFRKLDPEIVEWEKDEQKKKLGIVARHITRVFYKQDSAGFIPREKWHIWTINARTGTGKQLTDGDDYNEYHPCWSPDGKKIAFLSNRNKNPDLTPEYIDIYIMAGEGGKMRKIGTPRGPKITLSFSPDGKTLAYVGREGKGDWWRNWLLWITPTSGNNKARCLTCKFDFNVFGQAINDLVSYPHPSKPTWSKDGEKIYFPVGRHGNVVLKSIGLDGSKKSLETCIGETGVTGEYRFNRSQDLLVYYHGDMSDPGQIYCKNMHTKKIKKLTGINKKLLNNRVLGEIEEVWFTGSGGRRVQGWILKPPGFKKTRKYPAILEIHGGPFTQYGNLFMHEFYFLASNGYAVYFCNPRGSQGYGEEHARAINNAWGTVDYDDLMKFTNLVQRKPYIDKNKLGVAGGSYGGYMTNWIIGHTNRFKAAITQRCVSNMISMVGSSDGNWIFQQWFDNRSPWEDFDNYWEQSPLKHIKNAKTPTLVIHSEKDYRTAMEQGEQLYVALKVLGVDTEMVCFPDESHELSRSGRTDRRVERLKHMLRWFDRHLKPNGK